LPERSRKLDTRAGFFSPSLDGGLPLFELFNPSRRSSSAIWALSAATSATSSSRDSSAAEKAAEEAFRAAEAKAAEGARRATEVKTAEDVRRAAKMKAGDGARGVAKAKATKGPGRVAKGKAAEEGRRAVEVREADEARSAAVSRQGKKPAEMAAPPAGEADNLRLVIVPKPKAHAASQKRTPSRMRARWLSFVLTVQLWDGELSLRAPEMPTIIAQVSGWSRRDPILSMELGRPRQGQRPNGWTYCWTAGLCAPSRRTVFKQIEQFAGVLARKLSSDRFVGD
jgi:hypothetical protein